jgi:hypothetical protein
VTRDGADHKDATKEIASSAVSRYVREVRMPLGRQALRWDALNIEATKAASMAGIEHRVFVLDFTSEPVLAFAAESVVSAEVRVQTPWFTQAVDDFCKRRKLGNGNFPVRPRLATDAEASLYWERADEFADTTDHFLIANISEP